MPALQELQSSQVLQTITAAAERRIPVTITVRTGNRWLNLHSRLVRLCGEHFWLEYPEAGDQAHAHQFSPAEKLGLSFKLKHHKYLFAVTVAGTEQIDTEDGQAIKVLSVCWPSRMQRLQRRAFYRADVPNGRIVRASFWPGGREAEPPRACSESPVFSGNVTNISAGGFQMRTSAEAADMLDTDFVVGVRLSFGAGREVTAYADAQFRHVEPDGRKVLIGFQFVGLAQTPEGREALQLITNCVTEFHQAMSRSDPRRR